MDFSGTDTNKKTILSFQDLQEKAWNKFSKFSIFNPECAKLWVWATPKYGKIKKKIFEESLIIPALKIRGEHCGVTEEGKQGRERQDGLDPWDN